MGQSESTEDYLEAILRLSKTGRAVRQVDVSEFMGYSKASISKAVSALKRSGFLTEAAHGALVLTPKGKHIAESVYERHRFFADMLIALGVEETTAQKDACRMEHAVSEESFAALKQAALRPIHALARSAPSPLRPGSAAEPSRCASPPRS